MTTASNEQRNGILTALAAFLIWGFSPLYYRALGATPAFEILAHRVVWSLLFTLLLVIISGQWRTLLTHFSDRRLLLTLLISSLLVSINWLGFIWGVNNGKALEASMGYFIMPIVMVVLGRLFLDEQLSRRQQLSLLLVVLGVLNLLFTLNQLPWLALLLAFSFGFYGLMRKKAPIGALLGLTMECLMLTPVGVIYLFYQEQQGQLFFTHHDLELDLLLLGTALITALPLLLFTSASKRLRLGTLGLLQYLNPTCQFTLAVFLFNEPFTQHHLHTFLLIWSGLIIIAMDSRTGQKAVAYSAAE